MTEPTVLIQYIGNKPVKKDTVCCTGTLWTGNGDVQPFPRNKAVLLLRHKQVWRIAGEQEAAACGYGPATGIASAAKPPLQAEASVHDEESDPPPHERREVGQPTLTSVPVKTESGDQDDNGPEPVKAAAPNGAVDLVAVIRTMPKDEVHFSQHTNKPLVAKVRELSGDMSITAKDVAEAWKQIDGER
ncbi:hypothetical protein ACL7TT_01405 [Microbulbifer sp. 2304DJ12-6]|uniref:hypothetical protein n=1 Tax=Microbulbifer sp. 2304DJ12-6 TaxID=3233340 RepID=UPI00260353F3|nr:hypothetical protein [uncultured Microbulbifer sp.]